MFVFHFIYGLRIATNIPLPGVPVEPSPDVIDVRIHMREETSLPSPFSAPPSSFLYSSAKDEAEIEPTLRVGVLAGGEYFGMFYKDGAKFAVQREGMEIWADWPAGYAIEDACTYLIGPVMGFVLRLRGTICLHASCVAIGGQAIAIVGAPGAGKSTTAAAFAHLGFGVLSDDVVALVDRTDQFLVLPGYPRVNLWPDSVRTLFGSEDTLPRITPTWGKHYFQLTGQVGRFVPAPQSLGGIYVLCRREPGLAAPTVEDIAAPEALTTLVVNTYVNYLLDREMRGIEFDVLSRVVANVPVRRLRPTANPYDVFAMSKLIASDAEKVMSAEMGAALQSENLHEQF